MHHEEKKREWLQDLGWEQHKTEQLRKTCNKTSSTLVSPFRTASLAYICETILLYSQIPGSHVQFLMIVREVIFSS